MASTDIWTIQRILQWTTRYFKNHGVEEARLDAELLLEAKGFKDSVVSINDDSVDVIVGAAEITDEQKAQIEDIVTRKTERDVSDIVITTME